MFFDDYDVKDLVDFTTPIVTYVDKNLEEQVHDFIVEKNEVEDILEVEKEKITS